MDAHQVQTKKFTEQETAQTIPQRFSEHVALTPESTAVATPTESLSYAELDGRSNQVANAILDRCPEDAGVTAVLLDQGIESVIAILAVLKARKTYVSLNPRSDTAELHRFIDDCSPGLVISTQEHRSLGEQLLPTDAGLFCMETAADYSATPNSAAIGSPDSPAYIFYTSGSTGLPKGVVDSHRNVLHNVMRYTNQLGVTQNDRLSMIQACNFSGTVSSLFTALLNGATICPFNFAGEGMGPMANFLIRSRVTIYHSVPGIFESLVNTGKTFSEFRVLRLEGDRTEPRHIALFNRGFARNCRLAIGLGATETGLTCQHLLSRNDSYPVAESPIGYPVEGITITLVDELGREVAQGEPGEIQVTSRYLATGYWRQPELTERCFVRQADNPEIRSYRTGDMARVLSDGCMAYLGRKDFRVKMRGISIETTHVELTLQSHPLIANALVEVLVPRRGVKQLVAYLKMHDGVELPVCELRHYIGQHLPSYMLPARYHFLQAIPVDSHGKIDRRRLPPLDTQRPLLLQHFEPPQTAQQIALARCFEEILSLDKVGIRDNFYDLGGDSLLAMELLLLVEERTGFTFEQGKFFDSPDISTLEKNLVEKPAAASIVALQPLGERPPLWCLHNELGVVMHYLSLARLLGHDVPVLGLQAATIAPDATEVTIEAMAEDYLDLIRQRQVSGPYFLCGNCFDGLLAFEIARLLVDEGESVEFLGLIETSMPTGPLRAALDTAKRSEHPLRTLCGIAWRQCRKALTSPPKQAADGSGQAGQEDVPTAEAPVDPLFTLANNRTSKMMKNAADRYRPKPYGGEINLFYTGEADAYEGWRRVARGGVTATPLPIKRDDHMPHLVLHPMVKDLAREFRSKLNLPSQPRREKD